MDHLDVRRILTIVDPRRRAEALLPYFLQRQYWGSRPEAEEGLVACGEMAGDLLLKIFHEPEQRKFREPIIMMWGKMNYRGSVDALIDLLREDDKFWAEQRLEPGWWNDIESTITERRRNAYGEVLASVVALGQIGDVARATEVIEQTKRRWRTSIRKPADH